MALKGLTSVLLFTACSTVAVEHPMPLAPDPFSLQVELDSTQVVPGQFVGAKYSLTNKTDAAVSGCASDWGGGFWLHDHSARGGLYHTNATCRPEYKFTVPAHATLSWTTSIEVFNVGLGAGQFIGRFESIDGSWLGEVRSGVQDVVFIAAQ